MDICSTDGDNGPVQCIC